MREWCSCGAAIRGRRADVIAWRKDHRHDPHDDGPGPMGAESRVEINPEQTWLGNVGFRPNN